MDGISIWCSCSDDNEETAMILNVLAFLAAVFMAISRISYELAEESQDLDSGWWRIFMICFSIVWMIEHLKMR